MQLSDRIVNIIEDHESMVQFIDHVMCAIENEGVAMPNFVPILHDTMVSDQLSAIVEHLKKTEK